MPFGASWHSFDCTRVGPLEKWQQSQVRRSAEPAFRGIAQPGASPGCSTTHSGGSYHRGPGDWRVGHLPTGTWTWLAGHDELSLGFHKSMRFTKARRTWPDERFGTWIQDKQLIQRCNIRITLLGFMVPQTSLKRKVSRTWQPKGIFKAPAKGTPKDRCIFLRSLSLSSAMLGCRARFLGRKEVAHAQLTWYKH